MRGFVDRDERSALAVDGVRCQDPGGDQGHGGEELGAGRQVEREEFLSKVFSLILSFLGRIFEAHLDTYRMLTRLQQPPTQVQRKDQMYKQ